MQTIAGPYRAPLEREHLKGDLCVPFLEEVEGFFSSLVPKSACVFRPVSELQAPLFREEEEAISPRSERRRYFVAGRTAVRMAMSSLGLPPCPIYRGESGEPVWPFGVCGSIAHSKSLCFCIVAEAGSCSSIGVDVEDVERIRPELARKVMTPAERSEWEKLDESEALYRLALVFSAKEAYFKFQYPLTGRFVGFGDAEVHLNPRGRLRVEPLADGPSASGCARIFGGVTAVALWD